MQFTRNTSSSKNVIRLIVKLSFVLVLFFGLVFILNKVDFPAPKKELENVIPIENFKIVK